MHRLHLCFVAVFSVAHWAPAQQLSYSIRDLGTLAGGTSTHAQSINAAGDVAGTATMSNGATRPFFWSQSRGLVDIAGAALSSGSSGQAFWINKTDEIVGTLYNSQSTFFYNGIFGSLPGGAGSAKYINDAGQIAGHLGGAFSSGSVAYWPSPTSNPVDISGTVATDCGTPPGGDSDATFISNAGVVAGHSSKHAFVYDTQTQAVTCIPNPGPLSIAGAGNNSGQVVVGYFDQQLTFQSTLIWSPTGTALLGTINNYSRVIGGSINDRSQVVGTICNTCSTDVHGFLFSGGVMYDLNDLIPPNSGWVIQQATAINDAGSIVGYGLHNGQSKGFLLTAEYALPAAIGGGNQTAPSGFSTEPVNTANGNYYLSHNDLTMPGKGLAFAFTRAYNTLDPYSGPFGAGWTHSFNIILTVDPTTSQVFIKEADGHTDTYIPIGSGVFAPALPGLFDTLVGNTDGTFTLTRKNRVSITFSASGKITAIVDRNGNTQSLAYDNSANLASIVDTSGRTISFAADANRHITGITDPLGRSWQFSYDTVGNLVSVRDPATGLTQYSYDGNHRMTSAVDPRGVTFLQNTFDQLGRVATQTNGRGFLTTFAYNSPAAGTTTFTDPLGNTTKHLYDGSLRLSGITDANGGTISYAYDANNDPTSLTNQNGATTTFTYDSQGNTTGIIDALGNTQAFTYDAQNNLLTATSPKSATTTFTYDSQGNLLSIKDAVGDTTAFTYTSAGQITAKTDARSNATAFTYDGTGNLTKTTDPLSHATTFTYDAAGRRLTTTDANGHTASVTYDVLNRTTKTTDPLASTTQFSYDGISNLLTTADANGKATSYAYDATNNLTIVTDAAGGITTYGYDANNNRTSFTNAKGNTTTYAYDSLNRLSQVTDPLSFQSAHAYDAVGNTTSTTDANGNTNRYSYDTLNRFTAGSFADGSSVAYAYDKDGKRTSMTDWRGTTTYSYDALDRIVSVTAPGANPIQYAYDAAGNRNSLIYPDGRTVGYHYDALNRLSQVTDWANQSANYNYDPAGNLAGFEYPNGAFSSYSYDAANRLLQVINHSRSQLVSSFTYGLDNVGNRTQVTTGASGTNKYGYDSLYRLTSWTAPSGQVTQYTYDQVGNRLSLVSSAGTTAYTYDAADRMLSAGTTTYTYDANGNQIAKTTGSTAVNYSYDASNRLTAVSGGGINSQYRYDGDGNRVAQSVPSGMYEYLNDTTAGLKVVLNEFGPDGNIDYLYGLALISETSTSFQYFYQTDGLGSTASLTDSIGTLKASYTYDPWGKLTTALDPLGTKNKYKFATQALDPGTGLYFLRARYYDNTLGRLITRDQLRSVTGQTVGQLYQYALANPIRFVDPRGLSSIDTEFSGASNSGSTQPVLLTSSAQPTVATSRGPSSGWQYFEEYGISYRARQIKTWSDLTPWEKIELIWKGLIDVLSNVPVSPGAGSADPGPGELLPFLAPNDPRYQIDPNSFVPLPINQGSGSNQIKA